MDNNLAMHIAEHDPIEFEELTRWEWLVKAIESAPIEYLWAAVKAHPDYAGGAVFDRADVARAFKSMLADVRGEDDYGDDPTPEEIAAVTDEQMAQSITVLEDFPFRSYSWEDALRDTLTWPDAPNG